jgi:2-polyprenyl-3-methyl-5-hydroxy-6-metoxy-1,4-benzoquinol methylase
VGYARSCTWDDDIHSDYDYNLFLELVGDVERLGAMDAVQDLLAEQTRYYRARAGEYDDWWFRRDRYDRGPQANARWFADGAAVEAALERFAPTGDVLELACGTGLWTERLLAHADTVTAIDASPEVIEIARARTGDRRVEYAQADLFAWEPQRVYDVCFFSFWLSHVPDERFAAFWESVRRAVAPSGRVFFVDSARSDFASAADHKLAAPHDQVMLRRLADGSEYRIVKHWFEPDALQRRLAQLGWNAELRMTSEFFIYGEARPGS